MRIYAYIYTRIYVRNLREAVANRKPVVPVGTTSVRTLESLYWWGVKLLAREEEDSCQLRVLQWDPYRLAHLAGGWEKLPAVMCVCVCVCLCLCLCVCVCVCSLFKF
jgi:hypothetical protein